MDGIRSDSGSLLIACRPEHQVSLSRLIEDAAIEVDGLGTPERIAPVIVNNILAWSDGLGIADASGTPVIDSPESAINPAAGGVAGGPARRQPDRNPRRRSRWRPIRSD